AQARTRSQEVSGSFPAVGLIDADGGQNLVDLGGDRARAERRAGPLLQAGSPLGRAGIQREGGQPGVFRCQAASRAPSGVGQAASSRTVASTARSHHSPTSAVSVPAVGGLAAR
ncbi:hypothetical protein, partial [Streptomyces pharetrae]|uniref:hypothetical protein n=1 Tax=Streptomyces pharetrae TaxID=291370 RepID=UPI003673AC54